MTANPIPPAAINDLRRALAPDRVLSAPEDLLVFEYDGTIERGQPQVVVVPPTPPPASSSSSPMARSSGPAAPPATSLATTSPASSSAPRAPSASSPRP